jgi:hypothetical protein
MELPVTVHRGTSLQSMAIYLANMGKCRSVKCCKFSTLINTVGTATNAAYYPTFVNANNATIRAMNVYTTSSIAVNPFYWASWYWFNFS